MRKFTTLALGAAMIAGAGIAEGAVVVNVTNLGTPTATISGNPVSFPGFTAFKLTAVSTDSALVAGFDFGGTAGNPRGIVSPTGSMLQRWAVDPDTGDKTPTPQLATLNGSTSVNSFDSHWLIPAASRIDVSAPSESNGFANFAGGPNDTATSDYGGGDFLKGVFSLVTGARAGSVDFAYLVIPNNASVTFSGIVSTNAAGAPQFPVTGVVAVPEPAAAGALALVGVAALGRRRRELSGD